MAPNNTTAAVANPNENLRIPQWINEAYFVEILKDDLPNFKKIISFQPIAATAPGENYCSIMLRVIIEAELKDATTTQLSYILKTMLDKNSSGAAIANNMNMFPKEKQMYSVILPKFVQLYRQAAGVEVRFGPTSKYAEETPERITLVMEDLKRENYSNYDRLKGLDMKHMTRVLQKLAEFHAASACYYESAGSYGDLYQNTFFTEANRQLYVHLQKSRDPLLKRAMREWPLNDIEDYINRIPSGEQMFDEGLRLNFVDPTEFNVLNHGDLWTNNIMFKHNEQGLIYECLFVDFQAGKWGTPAWDLWYLIITSAAKDIKTNEFDQFIFIYHKQLVESLKLLKYTKPLPSLKYLHEQMLKYGSWGFSIAKSILSGILLPSNKDASFENFMKPGPEGDALRLAAVSNEYYTGAMCVILPFLRNKGLMDF
uniref:CHK kinase-like domain-containing protein n=1 Tax=Ceratitis capitata TaxID=7213 RepID=W8BIC5_CERCA